MKLHPQDVRKPLSRERGSAMVTGLVLTTILLGLTAALVMTSFQHDRLARQESDHTAALFLADAGIAAAGRELVDRIEAGDPAVEETLTVTTANGSYEVETTSLGDGTYLFESTGFVADQSVDVAATVRVQLGSKFPPAAISVLGEFKKAKVKFKKHHDLLIDGNGRAAMIFDSDKSMYEVADEFLHGIKDKEIKREQVKGGRGTFLEPKKLDKGKKPPKKYGKNDPNWHYLPFEQTNSLDGMADELVSYYEDLLIGAEAAIGAADTRIGEKLGSGSDVFQFGTEDDPAIVHFEKYVKMKGNDVIEGYGTLIVSDELKLYEDAQLNWVGDIIVVGDKKKKAKVQVDGQFNVDGNLFVLGEGKENAEFKIKDDASSTINGNLFVGTHYDEKKSKKAKFEVDGKLTVNGILSFLGRKVEIKFKDDSDAEINGFMQMAVVDNDKPYELKLEFDGKTTIRRDLDAIYEATDMLARFADRFGIDENNDLLQTELEILSWTRTPQSGAPDID